MSVTIGIPCGNCGSRHAEDARRLKRMVERSGVENFKLEHTCPACGHKTMLGQSFAELVLKVA